jgi:hypothetical protein
LVKKGGLQGRQEGWAVALVYEFWGQTLQTLADELKKAPAEQKHEDAPTSD